MTRRLVNALDALPDHYDAWCLAHERSKNSNLARCYIELRKIAEALVDECGPNTTPSNGAVDAVRLITNSNGD